MFIERTPFRSSSLRQERNIALLTERAVWISVAGATNIPLPTERRSTASPWSVFAARRSPRQRAWQRPQMSHLAGQA